MENKNGRTQVQISWESDLDLVFSYRLAPDPVLFEGQIRIRAISNWSYGLFESWLASRYYVFVIRSKIGRIRVFLDGRIQFLLKVGSGLTLPGSATV